MLELHSNGSPDKSPPIFEQTVKVNVRVEHQRHSFAEVYTREKEATYSRTFFDTYRSMNVRRGQFLNLFNLVKRSASSMSQTSRDVFETEQLQEKEAENKQRFQPGSEQIFRSVSVDVEIQNRGVSSCNFSMLEKECVESRTRVRTTDYEDLLALSTEHMMFLTGMPGTRAGRTLVTFEGVARIEINMAEEIAKGLMARGVPRNRLSYCLPGQSQNGKEKRHEDPRLRQVRASLQQQGLYEDGLEFRALGPSPPVPDCPIS